MGGERRLRRDPRCDCLGRVGEGDQEGVALGIDLVAAVGGESGTEESAMLGEDLGIAIAEAVQHLGAALDVSEEEGDRSRPQP